MFISGKTLKKSAAILTALCILTGCGKDKASDTGAQMDKLNDKLTAYSGLTAEENNVRTCYEVFVYSFSDSDGDGIGDLKGLSDRLDMINDGDAATKTDLECTEIWTMPIFPSPTYHKYDITDFKAIDPEYGTMEDFDSLLAECHKRGIKLIIDLPVNHTSNEHPWFKEASDYIKGLSKEEEPDTSKCKYISYYNFTKEAHSGYEKLNDEWYYEARFWSGMPDLNLDNEAVKDEIKDILYFWIDKGVDGFRLDAVTSYYTEDKQKNIDFIEWLNKTVKEKDPDSYIVGEAWTDFSIYSEYYKSGADSFFDFNFAGQDGVIASVVKGSRKASYYGEQLVKEEEELKNIAPDTAVNAPFYTNHDMARSAGYYVNDDGSKVKLAGALNLLTTGNAFIYYGEELGLRGSGKDENKRVAFPWTAEDSSELKKYICKGPAGAVTQELTFGSYEDQAKDPYSVYNYFRNAVRVRNAFPAISKGSTKLIEELNDDTASVFVRSIEGDDSADVLIAVNTGAEKKEISLDSVSEYKELKAVLTVSKDKVSLKGSKLTLPPYGIAFITRSSK
ncbi:Glycosidase [Eubacterium ruminantium]|nr:Glycosidase [Eubacterium ruminantium]